jgi:hypothetical protein
LKLWTMRNVLAVLCGLIAVGVGVGRGPVSAQSAVVSLVATPNPVQAIGGDLPTGSAAFCQQGVKSKFIVKIRDTNLNGSTATVFLNGFAVGSFLIQGRQGQLTLINTIWNLTPGAPGAVTVNGQAILTGTLVVPLI